MEWRRRGLELLFEFYAKHKGIVPGELCKQLGISIGSGVYWLSASTHLPLFGGRLLLPRAGSRQWEIALGCHALRLEWVSSFVIGHELGHYCLLSHDTNAYMPSNVTEDLRREMEYWCDGFAIALIFSVHGREVLSAEFLTDGTLETDTGQDVFQGKRILRLCEEHFVDPPQELLQLGDVLARAKEVQRRLDKI